MEKANPFQPIKVS